MVYPRFSLIDSRGMIPHLRLPRNYRELLPLFYQQERKEEITRYCLSLAELLKESPFSAWVPVRLNWDNTRGLISICVGTSAGLDLSECGWPSFQEHNLGTMSGIVAGAVALEYICELLKSGE